MMGWQWHQLDGMQIICTSLRTDIHASTSSLIFTGRMLFLTPNHNIVKALKAMTIISTLSSSVVSLLVPAHSVLQHQQSAILSLPLFAHPKPSIHSKTILKPTCFNLKQVSYF